MTLETMLVSAIDRASVRASLKDGDKPLTKDEVKQEEEFPGSVPAQGRKWHDNGATSDFVSSS